MIDIIIPAYNSNTINRTLYSIAYQSIVDRLNVYIVNDGSDFDYSDCVEFFSNFMNICELKLDKNSGPGVARRYGINNSSGEFIVFIDSDDVFYDCFSISKLYNKINDSDVVIGNFVEEIDGSFYNHDKDTIWLHGKIYRRSFLVDNDINFNDSRFNEDNGFNQLVFLANSKVEFLNDNVYIWLNNKDSITRRDNNKELFNLLMGYIYNLTWALDIAVNRGYSVSKISELSFSALVAIYCHYLRFNDDLILRETKKLKSISDKYPTSNKLGILSSQLSFIDIGDTPLSISFDNFLSMVDSI